MSEYNFMIRFSENRRAFAEKLKSSAFFIQKQRSNFSFLVYDTLPIIISSSILFPLYRMKLLLQTNYLREGNTDISNVKTAYKCK